MSFLLSLKDGAPRIKFALGESCTIGRSSECEIQILDPQLSRRHARIRRVGDAYRLEDLGSRNGTFLAGARVTAPLRLAPGDQIQIGDQLFVFDPDLDVLHMPGSDKTIQIVGGEAPPALVTGAAAPATAAAGLDATALAAIHELTCEVLGELDLELLLDRLLDRYLTHFRAERGFILAHEAPGRFRPLAARTERAAIAVSRTLLDRVLHERRPVLFDDALEHVSFVGARSIVEHQLRSVMLVPLVVGDTVTGVLQLDRRDQGAFDAARLDELALLARAAALAIANARRFERERRRAAAVVAREVGQTRFVGEDPRIVALLGTTAKAAASDASVLITGESGTGKELIARMLHEGSPRADGPWIAVNCAAVPESLLESELFGHERGAFSGASRRRRGCFELADGGTLFLDEIGEIPPAVQVKLLRALQERCFYRLGSERPLGVDIRVVAATNQRLAERIAAGAFREDLYYRLNVIALEVPPLRERAADVEALVEFFVERFARRLGKPRPRVAPRTLELLAAYPWPGNVRELANVVERLLVLHDAGPIAPPELPAAIREPGGGPADADRKLAAVIAATERRLIADALARTRGNKAAACRLLGISRPTMDKKIADYGIER